MSVAKSAQGGDGELARAFFKEEYQLDYELATFPKPFVALMHGICMGGGVGLSMPATYRVATDKTMFAMPETAIGLFPDVGGGYFLPRLKGELGMFLALSGHRLTGKDVADAGLATHYIDSADLPQLEEALSGLGRGEDLPSLLDAHCDNPDGSQLPASLADFEEAINHCFSAASVEEMMSRLNGIAAGSDEKQAEWASKVLKGLGHMSPLSICVTFEQLRRGAQMELSDVFTMEYRLSQNCMDPDTADFCEGVRALLIDRDKNPAWKHRSVDNVPHFLVEIFFSTMPDGATDLKLGDD